jgi:hypothetical protein
VNRFSSPALSAPSSASAANCGDVRAHSNCWRRKSYNQAFLGSISHCSISGTQGRREAHLPGPNRTGRTGSPGRKPEPFSESSNPAPHYSCQIDAPRAAEGRNADPLPLSSELVLHMRPQPSKRAAEGWSSSEDSSWSSWR